MTSLLGVGDADVSLEDGVLPVRLVGRGVFDVLICCGSAGWIVPRLGRLWDLDGSVDVMIEGVTRRDLGLILYMVK